MSLNKIIKTLVLGITLIHGVQAATVPRVLVSIAPIHSLVAGVMEGVGQPALLLSGYGSPHTYRMRPSDAAGLSNADLVFWVGESLETFLPKPLANLTDKTNVVKLMDVRGMPLLPNRKSGVWPPHPHAIHGEQARRGPSNQTNTDPHFWLDPRNALAVIREAVKRLSIADPAHGATYKKNGANLEKRIAALDAELERKLSPVRDKPYIVFHDAYQYLEKRYALNAVGAVTPSPDRGPGAKSLAKLRREIRTLGARCLFTEPQFQPALVTVLLEGTTVRLGILDPLGMAEKPGKDAYFRMMRANAAALSACLSDAETGFVVNENPGSGPADRR